MNPNIALAGLLILFAGASAMAADANSCVEQSARLKPSERSAFMDSCLAQLRSQSSVEEAEQRERKAQCEQNARNLSLQGDAQARYIASCMEGAAQPEIPVAEPVTGSLDLGLGFGFADLNDTTAGLDILLGAQRAPANGWQTGGNLHILSGPDFESAGLYATARPENRWVNFLQFHGGLIYANHNYAYQLPQDRWSGVGLGVGVGLVANFSDSVLMHIFDIQHGYVAGHSFNIYSFNVLVVIGALGHK